MKIRFKTQPYQTAAVEAVAECFAGQPHAGPRRYQMDRGVDAAGEQARLAAELGLGNAPLALPDAALLENIRRVQKAANLPPSGTLARSTAGPVNLDVEMETGTGKTYCYIKTMFELHRRCGWSKFVVVVPSIAIREGVKKSFEITAEHFLEAYGRRARFFVYDSKRLHEIESFSSDAGVSVMIINAQAFNSFKEGAKNKSAKIIFSRRDDFQSRRPIDVIRKNQPILILDEPQKMEGAATKKALAQFDALAVLRYSATHKTTHDKIHRLDALDAYQQKLVKKIAVRGISVRGLAGTHGYLYVESIETSAKQAPTARVEMEKKTQSGVKREVRRIKKGDRLFELSGEMEQYRDRTVSEIDARTQAVSFTDGTTLEVGEASGDVNADDLRRIQIREAVAAHLEKERSLFDRGIKVLTLFFIDEVAKYRRYEGDGGDDDGEAGAYAAMFEAEYTRQRKDLLGLFEHADDYARYLRRDEPAAVHAGYFSVDKKKRLVDPSVRRTGELAGQTDDVDAYDLIMRDKERLLSLDEPVRFVFSHSALREGWDNPNVFVICTLKHTDNTTVRRQEVGRGLRLCVDQTGERVDHPATVHQTNVLTVVANESYRDFVGALQKEIRDSLSDRPRKATKDYFRGKVIPTADGPLEVTADLADAIEVYLLLEKYADRKTREILPAYHEARDAGTLAELPEELRPYAEGVFALVDSVFDPSRLPGAEDGRRLRPNPLNANFEKKAFQELWNEINRKAIYTVNFDSAEMVGKCVRALDVELKVAGLTYTVVKGEQAGELSADALARGEGFVASDTSTQREKNATTSNVVYDLLGRLAGATRLRRSTVAAILGGITKPTFDQYPVNPEAFMREASRIINEQKATVIVQRLTYDPVEDRHDSTVFTQDRAKIDPGAPSVFAADRHVFDYVFTDSTTEKKFVEQLDISGDVVVYAKLPRAFFIPTPVGDYNPDWAIAFEAGNVKHVYFVAETKGTMSSLELRGVEDAKIRCARQFFARITDQRVRYEPVDGYAKLMDLVR